MPTFIIENNPDLNSPIHFSQDDEKHLVKSLRIKVGEKLQVTNNQGDLARVEITNTQPLEARVLEKHKGEKPGNITLCLPLIDQDRMEWAIEKLTELNLKTVQLITTERTQLHKISEKKFDRLIKKSIAAQKQCGRAYPLQILSPIALDDVLHKNLKAIFIMGSLNATHAKTQNLSSLSQEDSTFVVIGPEGGLSEAEEKKLSQRKVLKVNLGQTVLRTETAALGLFFLLSRGRELFFNSFF